MRPQYSYVITAILKYKSCVYSTPQNMISMHACIISFLKVTCYKYTRGGMAWPSVCIL